MGLFRLKGPRRSRITVQVDPFLLNATQICRFATLLAFRSLTSEPQLSFTAQKMIQVIFFTLEKTSRNAENLAENRCGEADFH